MENINTKEYWNENYSINGFYQDHVSDDWERQHAFIKKALPTRPQRILEVACGLGHNAQYAAQLGHYVIATDFSDIAINANKIRFAHDKVRYEILSVEESVESFKNMDVIMAFEILEHYEDPILPLLKIFKALKEGGILVFSVPTEAGRFGVWSQHYSYWNYQSLGDRLFKVGFKKFEIHKQDFNDQSIEGVAYK